MNALPYFSSHMADDLTMASIRLQRITHEPWGFDWQRCVLICTHGITLNFWSTRGAPTSALKESLERRHDLKRP